MDHSFVLWFDSVDEDDPDLLRGGSQVIPELAFMNFCDRRLGFDLDEKRAVNNEIGLVGPDDLLVVVDGNSHLPLDAMLASP